MMKQQLLKCTAAVCIMMLTAFTLSAAIPQQKAEAVSDEQVSGKLILDLTVNDSTRTAWSIDPDLQPGDLIFGDREVIWQSLPSEVIGGEAIVTACDAKNSSGDTIATFRAGADMNVYIALDSRVTAIPAWMQDYTKTALNAENNNNVAFDLYSKYVKAGKAVTLGANGQSAGCVNYAVFASFPKDITNDGATDVQDVNALRNYLLTVSELQNPAAADFNSDGKINAVDLTMLKQKLMTPPADPEQPEVQEPTNRYESADFKFSGRIFVVGDSTVCEYDSNTQTSLNRYGWGMKLAQNFSNVTVTNLALSGRSSRSFLKEKNYQTLKSSIGKGDYLFIQFGHNDEKTDETKTPGVGTYPNLDWSTLDSSGKDAQGRYSFEYILTAYYINLAKNAGAQPVLVTPVTRRGSNGTANYKGHVDYQNGMKALGQNYNVPVIDMTALTTQLYTSLYNAGGANETAKMHCYTDSSHSTIDNTHLSNAGAQKIAQMIAEQTKVLGLQLSDRLK